MEGEDLVRVKHEADTDHELYKQISNNFLDTVFQSAIEANRHHKVISHDFNLPTSDNESFQLMSRKFLDNIYDSVFACQKQQTVINQAIKNEDQSNLNPLQTKNDYESLPMNSSSKIPLNSFENLLSIEEDIAQKHKQFKETYNLQIEKEIEGQINASMADEKGKVQSQKALYNIVDLKMCGMEDSIIESQANLSQYEAKQINDNEGIFHYKNACSHNSCDQASNYTNEDIETLTKAVEPDDIDDKSIGLIHLIKIEKESTDFNNEMSQEEISAKSKRADSYKKEQEIMYRHHSSFGSSLSNIKEENAKHSFQPNKAKSSFNSVIQYEQQEGRFENNREESRKNLLALLSTKKIDEVMIENDKSVSRIDVNVDPSVHILKVNKKEVFSDLEVLKELEFERFKRNGTLTNYDCKESMKTKLIPTEKIKNDENKIEIMNTLQTINQSNLVQKSTKADDHESNAFDIKEEMLPLNARTVPNFDANELAFRIKLQEEILKIKERLKEEMLEEVNIIKESIRNELRIELLEKIREGNFNKSPKSTIKSDNYLLKKSQKMKELKKIPVSDLVKSMHLTNLPNHLYLKKNIDISRFAKQTEEVKSKLTCQPRFSSSILAKNSLKPSIKPINSARFVIDASRKKGLVKLCNYENDYFRSLKKSFSPGPSNFFIEANSRILNHRFDKNGTSVLTIKDHHKSITDQTKLNSLVKSSIAQERHQSLKLKIIN